MKNDNFAEYAKELEGMDRIELVLDLLVDKKITKDQAVVLIANDKQIKEKPVKTEDSVKYPNWWNTPGAGTITTTPYVTNPSSYPTTTNPYTITTTSSGYVSGYDPITT